MNECIYIEILFCQKVLNFYNSEFKFTEVNAISYHKQKIKLRQTSKFEQISLQMSIYHRRVFLKQKMNPQPAWMTKQLSIEQVPSESTQTTIDNRIPDSTKTKSSKSTDCKTRLTNFINNQWYSIIMSVITIYTIFAIDIDKAFFNVQASTYFSSIHVAAIGLFITEIILLSITRDDYLGKFYFWIDCFSTLTMFLEIIWIENLMSTSSDVTVAISFAKVTKASRLSKIGARSSKIMKLIRLVKLMKFLDKEQKPQQKDQIVENKQNQKIDPDNLQFEGIQEESNTQQDDKQFSSLENENSSSSNNEENNQNQSEKSSHESKQSNSLNSPPSFGNQNQSRITFLGQKKNSFENSKINIEANQEQSQYDYREKEQQNFQRKQQPNEQDQKQITQNSEKQEDSKYDFSRINISTNKNLHNHNSFNLKEEAIQLPQSFGEINELSEDGQQNINDLMKIFFTRNFDKFVEEGRHISNKSISSNMLCQNINPSRQNFNSKFSINLNIQSKINVPTGQNSTFLPQIKRAARNSSRLSFIRRKQLIDLSRNREGREKGNRYNPNFTAEAPFSNIVQKLSKSMNLPPLNRPNVDTSKQMIIQKKYQQLVQKLKQQNQPKKVLSWQNLKVGQVLKQQIQKNIVIMVMGLIMILPMITADTWFDQDSSLSLTANIFIQDINQLPTDQAKTEMMQSFIQTGLCMSSPLEYFNIPLNSTCCEFPQDFPQYTPSNYIDLAQLRLSEQIIVIDGNMTIIFSKKQTSQVTSYLNLGRSFFITLLLIFCSVLFMKDIQNYALNPLEKMSSLINEISNNPFDALKQINQQKHQKHQDYDNDEDKKHLYNKVVNNEDKKLQTNILSDVIIKITSLLTIGAGEIGSQIISKNIQELGNEKQSSQDANQTLGNHKNNHKNASLGQSQIGVYAYFQFRSFETVCDVFGDQIFKYINKITEIVHTNTIQFGGVPIQYDGKGFLLLWKSDVEIKGFQTSRKTVKKDKLSNDSQSLEDRGEQNQILAKLSILAINALTKITLELNRLQQSRRFYQHISQKYTSQSNQSNPGHAKNPFFHNQNYEPHLFSSSVHVGESFYGSMGSHYKLECKCIGYDISYTRWLCDHLQKQQYGVGNLISEDIYSLLEQFQGIVRRLNIRKIDALKIKQIRFKDRVNNSNLNYMSDLQLKSIVTQKVTQTSVYTFDFAGKLQLYNSNESQILHLHPNGLSFNLDQSHKLSSQDLQKRHQKISNKSSTLRLQSFVDVQKQINNKSLKAYQQRQNWMKIIKQETVDEVLRRVDSQNRDIVQARNSFQPQFYDNWMDSMDCFYSKDFTQALSEFKFLHTYNQFYDYPSKMMVNRIENLNIEEIEFEKNRVPSEENSFSDSSSSSSSSANKKKKWSGAKQVIWKV